MTGPTVQVHRPAHLTSFRYAGGDDDPIRISAYVSKGTAADVRAKMARPLQNTKLQLTWYIVSYDDEKKGWYEAALVRDTGKVEASVDTSNGEVQMFIANEGTRISETLDLKVFKFEFQIVPAANKSSVIEFATGPSQRLVKQWGDEDSGFGCRASSRGVLMTPLRQPGVTPDGLDLPRASTARPFAASPVATRLTTGCDDPRSHPWQLRTRSRNPD